MYYLLYYIRLNYNNIYRSNISYRMYYNIYSIYIDLIYDIQIIKVLNICILFIHGDCH